MLIAELIKKKMRLATAMRSMEWDHMPPCPAELFEEKFTKRVEEFHHLCQQDEEYAERLHTANCTLEYEGKTLAELSIRCQVLQEKLSLLDYYISAVFNSWDKKPIVSQAEMHQKYDAYMREREHIKAVIHQMNWTNECEEELRVESGELRSES
jgi:hypothetical protein